MRHLYSSSSELKRVFIISAADRLSTRSSCFSRFTNCCCFLRTLFSFNQTPLITDLTECSATAYHGIYKTHAHIHLSFSVLLFITYVLTYCAFDVSVKLKGFYLLVYRTNLLPPSVLVNSEMFLLQPN